MFFTLFLTSCQRAGFGLLDWEIYYRDSVLVWIKEWITLDNERLLKLEGHIFNLRLHAFIWCQKAEEYKVFNNHIIRKSLL